jgi:hypothetical protein
VTVNCGGGGGGVGGSGVDNDGEDIGLPMSAHTNRNTQNTS